MAKYEMKQATGDAGNYYHNGSAWVSNGNSTNPYCTDVNLCNSTESKDPDMGSIVSKPDGFPIVHINQYNALQACEAM